MALTLTTPVAVPNITRVRVAKIRFDEDGSSAIVDVEVSGAASRIYGVFTVVVRNGLSDKLARTGSSVRWDDLYGITPGGVSTASGLDGLVALGGANVAARNRLAETYLAGIGVLEAGS